jgi:UrcA family protein
MKLRAFVLAALAGAAFALPVAPAAAQDGETQSVSVNYSDLNLESYSGSQTMLRRIRRAAEDVCGYERSARELRRVAYQRICVERAMTDAVATADSERLLATYAQSDWGRRTADVTFDEASWRAAIVVTDLDLDSERGRAAFDARLERASAMMCGEQDDWWTRRQYRRCAEAIRTQALAQADAIMMARANTNQEVQTASLTPAPVAPVAASAPLSTEAQTGFGVCAARVHQTRFYGGRSLNQEQARALTQLMDSASVCVTDGIIVEVDTSDPNAVRRANAVAAALARQGVSRSLISVENVAGVREPQVRLSFSGVARSGGEAAPITTAVS